MHGSTCYSDGAQALRQLATVMREVLGPKAEQGETAGHRDHRSLNHTRRVLESLAQRAENPGRDARLNLLGDGAQAAARARDRNTRRARTESGTGRDHHYRDHRSLNHTGRVLESVAQRRPKTLAAMHGSTYYSDGAQAQRELATVMHDVLGPKAEQGETTTIGTIEA